MMRHFFVAAITVFLGLVFYTPMSAATLSCTASVTNVAFGAISVRDGNADQTTGTVSFTCSEGTPNATITTCLNLSSGSGGAELNNSPRYLRRNDSVALNYELRTGSNSGSTWNNESFTQTLDANGTASFPATIYAVITSAGSLLGGGAYSSIFSEANTLFSYGEGSCSTPGSMETFTVSANLIPFCTVSVLPLAFGSLESLNDSVNQNAAVEINCSSATTYSIKLGLGTGAGVSNPTGRKMTSNGNTITYGLYHDIGRTSPWGNQNSDDADGTGTGSPQSITVYGQIESQSTPPTGSYFDTVVVTIEY